MEINITAFFMHGIAPMDLSASIAETGANAGVDTWAASCEAARELQLLDTPEKLGAFAQFAKESGFGEDEKPFGQWPAREVNALFLQWIATDLREMGVRYSTDSIDWVRVEQLQEDGQCASNIYRGDDGQIYFYAGS